MDEEEILTHGAFSEGSTRYEVLDGVKYVVAPIIPARVGVMNGGLCTAENLKAHVARWNGSPIVVGHPEENGTKVSANSPKYLPEVVGRMYNVGFDDAKGHMKGEIWLNEKKMEEAGGQFVEALARVKGGLPLDVSTAFFSPLSGGPGVHDGAQYSGVFNDIRPDHLALLPNEKGACSWEDGCGVRANKEDTTENIVSKVADRILTALKNLRSNGMDKAKLVADLIANAATQFTDEDKEFLTALSEDQLSKLIPNECGCKKVNTNNKDEGDESKDDLKANESNKSNEGKPMTVEEQLDAAGITNPQIRAFICRGVRDEDAEKDLLLQACKDNKEIKLSDAYLEKCSLDDLRSFAQAYAEPDYSGLGDRTDFQANRKSGDVSKPPPVFGAAPDKKGAN